MEISIKRLVDRSEKIFFFKDQIWYLNNYLKIERGSGWKKSEKILYSKGLLVLLLTNVFRDLVLKRHLFRINCLIHCKKSVRIRSYSVWMQENADQNNSEYGRFSGNDFAWHSFLSKDKWMLTSFGIADTIGRFILPFAHFLISRFWLGLSNHDGIKRNGQTKTSIYILILIPYFLR